ncbi:uncharacterized protein V6R79_024312 [Siganus canaliculatus]
MQTGGRWFGGAVTHAEAKQLYRRSMAASEARLRPGGERCGCSTVAPAPRGEDERRDAAFTVHTIKTRKTH